LPACTARDVDRALKRSGLVVVHQKGSHRYYANARTGKVVTCVPMHPGDIKRPLLKKIIQDVGLTEDEFRELL
jgi:predicted RNA binding protein YcfA (HicA-like mRNA interferase family)